MWIGNSMLFNWLDRSLEKHGPLAPLSQGQIFMVHSSAFYDVEKKLLQPGELPANLHWFKWQNGFTWMTGISLLVIVYYANGAAFLIDVNVYPLAPVVAIVASRARCSSAGSSTTSCGMRSASAARAWPPPSRSRCCSPRSSATPRCSPAAPPTS